MREEILLKRLRAGDASAMDELVRMYYSEILRYCKWHAPDVHLAEDAAQETFLKALRYFDRYTHRGKFRAFLYQIAANTCIDMRRKIRTAETSLEEMQVDPAKEETGYEDVQSDLALRQMVKGLPPDQQEIVLLRFGQDLTMREIAEAVNIPLRTVQTRLRSALKKLKKEVERGGVQ